jgi:hypothetical protein
MEGTIVCISVPFSLPSLRANIRFAPASGLVRWV